MKSQINKEKEPNVPTLGDFSKNRPLTHFREMRPVVRGYCLTYALRRKDLRGKMANMLFGYIRETVIRTRGVVKIYRYYSPGIFHDTRYKTMGDRVIYIEDYPAELLRIIKPFCKQVRITEVEFMRAGLETGEEHWRKLCARREITVKWWDEVGPNKSRNILKKEK